MFVNACMIEHGTNRCWDSNEHTSQAPISANASNRTPTQDRLWANLQRQQGRILSYIKMQDWYACFGLNFVFRATALQVSIMGINGSFFRATTQKDTRQYSTAMVPCVFEDDNSVRSFPAFLIQPQHHLEVPKYSSCMPHGYLKMFHNRPFSITALIAEMCFG